MNNIPQPVWGLKADTLKATENAPQGPQERDRRLQNAAKIGLACSAAGVVMTIIAVVTDVVVENHVSPPGHTLPNDQIPPVLALPIIFSLVLMLLGIGLGIYTRKLRTGRIAIVVGLFPLAVYAFMAIMGIMYLSTIEGH